MRFINPKTDFAFKKIFGSENSKHILISFLNALLYEGQDTIQDLEIIETYSAGKVVALKDSYLDVKARISNGTTVIIEMQVINVEAFKKRVLYNAAKTYSNQLRKGEGYFKLKPVIALNITDFKVFSQREQVISHFVFQEREDKLSYPDNDLELVFVELPKFKKKLEELETITDKWIYFMRNTNVLEEVPPSMEIVPELEQAFGIANEANFSTKELEELEKREMFIEDQRGAVILGKREAREQGRRQGLQEGRQEGRQEGLQEGMQKLIFGLLQSSLGEISPEIETRIKQLPLEQLETLSRAILNFKSIGDLLTWLNDN